MTTASPYEAATIPPLGPGAEDADTDSGERSGPSASTTTAASTSGPRAPSPQRSDAPGRGPSQGRRRPETAVPGGRAGMRPRRRRPGRRVRRRGARGPTGGAAAASARRTATLRRRRERPRRGCHQLSETVTVRTTTGCVGRPPRRRARRSARRRPSPPSPADDRVLGREVDAVGGDDEELAARRPRRLEDGSSPSRPCPSCRAPREGGTSSVAAGLAAARPASGRRPESRSPGRPGGRPWRRSSRPPARTSEGGRGRELLVEGDGERPAGSERQRPRLGAVERPVGAVSCGGSRSPAPRRTRIRPRPTSARGLGLFGRAAHRNRRAAGRARGRGGRAHRRAILAGRHGPRAANGRPAATRRCSPTTTRSGASRRTTTATCSSSSRSRARRPGSRGRRSSASARATGAPSSASTPRRWPASREGRRAPARGPGHRPQPAEGRVDRRQCRPRARGPGGAREPRRLPVGLRRGGPIVGRWRSPSELPAETELSRALSKDLKKRGFRFVGPDRVLRVHADGGAWSTTTPWTATASGSSRVSAPIRYARSGDVNIAYQVTGDGPFDLVLVPASSPTSRSTGSPGDGAPARAPRVVRTAHPLRQARDRPLRPGVGLPDFETRMDDVRAVMDAAGSESRRALRLLGGRADVRPVRRDVPRPYAGPRPLRHLRQAM